MSWLFVNTLPIFFMIRLAKIFTTGVCYAFHSPRSSRGPLRINPLQNPLSKNHRVRDDRMQSWRWSRALQLAELASGEDRSSDQ